MTTLRVALVLALAAGCSPTEDADAGAPSCRERWTLPVEAAAEDLAFDGERLYVAGSRDGAGWLAAIDPCEGAIAAQRDVAPEGAETSSLAALAVIGGDVYAVGASTTDALVVRAAADLAPRWVAPLGDEGVSESLGDVVSAGGALWAAGEARVSPGSTRGLVVRVDPSGEACPLALPGALRARAIHALAGDVYVAASEGSTVVVHRFSETSCASAGCACAPGWTSSPIELGAGDSTVTALAVDGNRAWIAGYVIEPGPVGAAFLARLDLVDGRVLAMTRLDPTDAVDGFLDLRLDGDLVLAVGASGWDGAPGFLSARGVLAAFARDFAADAHPVVVLEPSRMHLVTGLVTDPGSARFFLAGLTGAGTSAVQQCVRAADGCDATTTGAWPRRPDEDAGTEPVDAGPPPAVDAGPPPASLVPAIDPRDGRRLVRGGRPWYPTGYYPGAALNMTGPDYAGDHRGYNERLIDRLASEGIDLFRVWINWGALTYAPASPDDQWDRHVLVPYARTGPGDAIDGRPRLDLDTWNEAYFAEIEHAVSYAEARGVVVQVLLLDCWHAGFGRSFGFEAYDYFAAGNNASGVSFASEAEWADVDGPVHARNTAFVEEVVRRIGHHENVIWETCNEPRWVAPDDPFAVAAHPFHARLAGRIHAVEGAAGHPRHLVVPVDLPEHRTVAGHRTPADRDAQSVDDFRRQIVDAQLAWGLPLVSDNDCCPGEPDAALLRRKAWAALTSGVHLDVFNNELFRRDVLENMNTTLGMRFVALPGRLVEMRGVDLATMGVCDATATPARWCYGHATGERVLYVEGGGATTLGGLPAVVDAVWFDPRDGAITSAGAGPSFTPPDTRDWVLHVR